MPKPLPKPDKLTVLETHIAAALRLSRPFNSEMTCIRMQWTSDVRFIASALKANLDAKFNTERFYEACGGLYY